MIKSICAKGKGLTEISTYLKSSTNDMDVKMMVYFASASFDQQALIEELNKNFSGAVIFGCSSAHEFTEKGFGEDSVVALAFSKDEIDDVCVDVVQNLSANAKVDSAVDTFEKYYNSKLSDLSFNKYVGLIMFDALSGAEDRIMDELGSKTDLIFLGGSASDKLTFTGTYVCCNGKAYQDAVLLALIKPTKGYDIIKTQSFDDTGVSFVVESALSEKRIVEKLSGIDAITAYSQAVNVDVDNVEDVFAQYTLGVSTGGGDVYVRSPKSKEGSGMSFYSTLHEGMEVSLLKASDIVADTKDVISKKQTQHNGKISGIINFHCLQRTLHLQNRGEMDEYINAFDGIPTIGFSTYGEQYLGHVNQTSTMLVFL